MKTRKLSIACIFSMILGICYPALGQGLSRKDAAALAAKSLQTAKENYRSAAETGWKNKAIHQGDHVMKFDYHRFGNAPFGKRSLYISLHGGGNAAARVNDQQWENQKKLYQPAEGIYLAPRAPTNTWNLWHEGHIDDMLGKIIKDAIVVEGVDPNKVYLLGYSAGGDGLYQLAPRMAGTWAAAAMMAGHPGDASALSLRNLPFAIYMGGNDAAYNRNNLARAWGKRLDSLQKLDPAGYVHQVEVYDGLGHWMNRRDTVAIPWMAGFSRNAIPAKVIWVQDDRIHPDFYWLGTDPAQTVAGNKAVVSFDKKNNRITVDENTFKTLDIYLNDAMLDLDKPVTVMVGGKKLVSKKLQRKEENITYWAAKYLDPDRVFSAKITLLGNKVSAP